MPVKPYYGPDDHVVYADIIGDRTPLQSFEREARYEQIGRGMEATLAAVNATLNAINTQQMVGFLTACQVKWEFSANVAAMFTSPSAGLIIPGFNK